ncbi:MAG: hypothetical protein OEM22_01575 [Acidimicrobiia bacterium]|nr:hypothetical protein [Acidimicrobiia bacterium]MDH3425336.1 hypothetical protein [Acidimicrobiia bacterium]
MTRLRRFEEHRFVGSRDNMVVYDCDDEAQFAELAERVNEEKLEERNMLSTFGPDSLAEAANRGFRSASVGPKDAPQES